MASAELFVKHCTTGNIKNVKKVLKSGLSPSTALSDNQKWDLVEDLCEKNRVNIVQVLFPDYLSPCEKISCSDVYTYRQVETVLFCVAVQFTRQGDLRILEHLVGCGADVNSQIEYSDRLQTARYSALTFSITLAHLSTSSYLASKGAQVNNPGDVIKFICCYSSDWITWFELVKEIGIDLNGDGCYPLHYLLPDPTNLLDSTFSFINERSYQLCAPQIQQGQHFSADSHLQTVKFLLDHGADPNKAEPALHLTAGHMVSRGHKVALYKLLLKRGWHVHATDTRGWNALHYAITGNDVNAITYLLKQGLALHDVMSDHGYLLPYHVIHGHVLSIYEVLTLSDEVIRDYVIAKIEVCKTLVEHGLNLDCLTHSSYTLAEMLCGVTIFKQLFSWILRQKTKLPFDGGQDKLDEFFEQNVAGSTQNFAGTFPLLAAGFYHCDFVKKHMRQAIIQNNRINYQITRSANPYAVYGLDMLDLETKIMDERKADDGEGFPDGHVLFEGMRDHDSAPSLLQITVYNTRCYLLSATNNTTLHSIIHSAVLPHTIKHVLDIGPKPC